MVLPCQDPMTDSRVDFIFSHSPYEKQAIRRAANVTIREAQVRFATAEDLIVHKMLAHRARDIEDVKNVMLRNPGLALPYIRRWLSQFSEALAQPFDGEFEQLLKDIS